MHLEESTNMEYTDLRKSFKQFLIEQGKKENTVNTMTNEVFFLWRKCGREAFWYAVKTNAEERRRIILETINKYASPNLTKYISGYMTSFNRFIEFLQIDTNNTISAQSKIRRNTGNTGKEPLTFTDEDIENVHKIVLESSDYGSDYELIEKTFNKFPQNDEPEIVAMKIALIDLTNSTHLSLHRSKVTIKEIVSVILNISDFDKRVCQGDPEIVEILARCNGKVNIFSFATKYCTYHNVGVYKKDDYSIYDNVVSHALPKYNLELSFSKIDSWRKAFDYTAFSNCIGDILDRNDISVEFRRRKFDHYLWYSNKNK